MNIVLNADKIYHHRDRGTNQFYSKRSLTFYAQLRHVRIRSIKTLFPRA